MTYANHKSNASFSWGIPLTAIFNYHDQIHYTGIYLFMNRLLLQSMPKHS